MNTTKLILWLTERRENCLRIAKMRTDAAERRGWLADAAFFTKAIEAARFMQAHEAIITARSTNK